MENKGITEYWKLFRSTLMEAQKKFILFKVRESKKIKRLPWLNCNHLSLLKCKTRTTPEMKKRTKTC